MIQNKESVSDNKDSYVINKLTIALLNLLKENNLDDISISNLCNEAHIGRASFYRNFNTKEDILKRYDKKLIKEWGKSFENDNKNEKESKPEILIPSLIGHYKKHKDFYLILYRENLSGIVLETILHAMEMDKSINNIEAYAKAFIGYGLFGIINEWFSRGMKESPEELLEIMTKNKDEA